jgi:arylsulfatase A-like enzyme
MTARYPFDHGASLGDHGERSHGTFAYNSTLHVPWILWSEPDTAQGIRPVVFPGRVRVVDVLPTILEIVGAQVSTPSDVAGQSLVPFLRGERDYEEPPVYFEALNALLTSDWAPLHGIVSGGFKYIDLPAPELYDLDEDPGELDNLYRRQRERARALPSGIPEAHAR